MQRMSVQWIIETMGTMSSSPKREMTQCTVLMESLYKNKCLRKSCLIRSFWKRAKTSRKAYLTIRAFREEQLRLSSFLDFRKGMCKNKVLPQDRLFLGPSLKPVWWRWPNLQRKSCMLCHETIRQTIHTPQFRWGGEHPETSLPAARIWRWREDCWSQGKVNPNRESPTSSFVYQEFFGACLICYRNNSELLGMDFKFSSFSIS